MGQFTVWHIETKLKKCTQKKKQNRRGCLNQRGIASNCTKIKLNNEKKTKEETLTHSKIHAKNN